MPGKPSKPSSPQPEPGPAAAPDLDWRRLRLWQIQPIRDALVLLGVIGLLYVGYLCSIVTVPMLLALALAYLVEPVVAWATGRFRWISRQGAAVAVIVLAGALVVVPVTVGVGFAVVQGSALVRTVAENTARVVASVQAETPEQQAAAREKLPPSLRDVGAWITDLRRDVEAYRARQAERAQPIHPAVPLPAQPQSEAAKPDAAQPTDDDDFPTWKLQLFDGVQIGIRWIQNNAETLSRNIGQQALGTGVVAFTAILGGLQKLTYFIFTACLTAFFFFFFCTGYGAVLDFWADLLPERKKGRVIDLVRKMDRVVAGFIRGRITICLILAVYVTTAYWLIGVPSPLLLGPAIGLLFIVPYVHAVGVPIAIILMAIDPSAAAWPQWWWIVFAPIGVYIGAQLLDDWILSPAIQGKSTGMDTPTILFASFAGGALAGVYGLLLAIPVAACIRILLQEVFWPGFREWGRGKQRDFLPIGRE